MARGAVSRSPILPRPHHANEDRRPDGPAVRIRGASVRLDGRPDDAEDLADLTAQEEQGDDGDDRDEGEDERVLGEPLAFLVPIERSDECGKIRHATDTPFPKSSPDSGGGGQRRWRARR